MTLASGLIEQDTAGDGGVQRFDGARHGNGDEGVGAAKDGRRNSAALVAEDQRARLCESVPGGRLAAGGHRGECTDAALGQLVEQMVLTGNDTGQAEDGARRRAQGLLIIRADGARENDIAGRAEGFRGANQGAEVAGVLQSGGDEEQRLGRAQDLLQSERRRLDEGGDSLRRLGLHGAGEDLRRQRKYVSGFGNVYPVEQRLRTLPNEDGMKFQPAGRSFREQVFSFDGEKPLRGS